MVAVANFIIDHWEGEPNQIYKPILLPKRSGVSQAASVQLITSAVMNLNMSVRWMSMMISGVCLLMLDDVGKEKPSDFTRELYWYVINER